MSCGCKLTIKDLTAERRKHLSGQPKINKVDFDAGKPAAKWLYVYFLNPVRFKEVFEEALKEHPINADWNAPKTQIDALVSLHESGKDKELFNIDFEQLLAKIPISAKMVNFNEIQFV